MPALLAPEGRAFLEIGSAQAGPVIELAAAAGLGATTRRDMAGLERCMIPQRPSLSAWSGACLPFKDRQAGRAKTSPPMTPNSRPAVSVTALARVPRSVLP